MHAWLVIALTVTPAADPTADYVIRGATVIDGTGRPARRTDVAIGGEQILAIGPFKGAVRQPEIDGAGLIVAPGFIDLHNHSDRSITKPETRANLNYLTQGVTTIVTGNCGGGRADVTAFLREIDRLGAGTNVAHLIPQGQLRREVVGAESRPPTRRELAQMKDRVRKAMKAGAFGMSTGLIYVPSSYAKADELIELAKVVGQHGGIYASHIRNEGTRVLEAIEEALNIGKQADLPVHISHFKTSGRSAWGLAPDAIEAVREARRKGQRVTADQYPYIASSTSLGAMLVPKRLRSRDRFREVLANPAEAKKLRDAMERAIKGRNGGESLYVAGYRKNRRWQGKNLREIAEKENRTPLEIAIDIQANGGAQMVSFSMREEDVRLIMKQPFVATASDGSAKVLTANTSPHPRSYGCFPRKIGYYCLEGKVLSLPQAIRSCSGLPADILGLKQRGYLKPKYRADVVVFDPRTFRDQATFQKPHQYSTGVKYLFVNGRLAIARGKPTGQLAGRALRRSKP